MQILFTTSRAIYEATRDELELIERTGDISVSVENTLIHTSDITEELIVAGITAYAPEKIWLLGEARVVDTEHQTGDIVMPNVFLKYSEEIGGVEFNKVNRDAYLHDPLFLRHYEKQEDVDFEVFGLSIGGICVSAPEWMDTPAREQLEFAYQADCVDTSSYQCIEAGGRLGWSEKLYPVLLITPEDAESTLRVDLAKNVARVVAYFQSDTIHDDDWENDRI